MRGFFFKLALFLLLQLVVCIAVFCLGERPVMNGYFGAICDKHVRFAQTAEPRLVFVGGSSVAFGLDSTMIGHSVDRNVVNLGIHAGLGMDFIIGDVPTRELKSGDVVVVSLEYNHFCADQADIDNLYQALKVHPASWRSLDFADLKTLLDGGFLLLNKYINRDLQSLFGRFAPKGSANLGVDPDTIPSIYTRDGFNAFGDFVRHWEKPVPEKKLHEQIEKYSSPDWIVFSRSAVEKVIFRLNDFDKICRERGAEVVFVYPALPQPVFEANQQAIDKIDSALRHDLTIRILDTPESEMAPAGFFFDTVYHLNRTGVNWRSGRMSSMLAASLR